MKILDALFNKKQETKEAKEELNSNGFKARVLRADGSILEIKSKSDVLGNPLYKSIYDKDIDLAYHFERYNVVDGRNINGMYLEKNYDIYMVLDKNKLRDEEYKYFFANVFLESSRLKKIQDVYFGYAGEIRKEIIETPNGNVEQYRKYLEKNVLNILQVEARTGIMSISQMKYYRKQENNSKNINDYER